MHRHTSPPHTSRLSAALFAALMLSLFTLTAAGCDDDPDSSGGDASSDVLDTGGDDTAVETCSETEPCDAGVCDTAAGRCVPRCTDASCGEGTVCDADTGLCTEAATCAESSECAEGETCDTCKGLCVDAAGGRVCVDDSNCFTSDYCDTCTGLCEPRKAPCEPCTFQKECGEAGDRCIDFIEAGGRFCGKQCSTFVDCDEGYDCAEVESGVFQCVPASGDCSTPAACAEDTDCRGVNTICTRGRCVPGCTEGGCPQGKLCELGRCADRCDSPDRTEPCPEGSECNTDSGLCELPGQCRSSLDCLEAETYCDLGTLQCVPGCQVDDDCLDATRECVDGSCAPRGCKGNYACAFEQVCELSSGQCQDAVGPYCDTCDPDTEGSCGPEENKCISLQDDEGNPVGDFCFVACADDPDNRCPQGYQCTELQDQDGNPAGEVCFRDCTFDPFGG